MITHKICDHSDEQTHPNEELDKEITKALKDLVVIRALHIMKLLKFLKLSKGYYPNKAAYKSDVDRLIINNFQERRELHEKLYDMGAIGKPDSLYKDIDEVFDRLSELLVLDPDSKE